MAKPQKDESDKLPKAEAQARFERTVKRMLNTSPIPHGKKPLKGRTRRSRLPSLASLSKPKGLPPPSWS